MAANYGAAFDALAEWGYGRDDGRARPVRAYRPSDYAPAPAERRHPCRVCKASLGRCVTCKVGKGGGA